MTTVAIDVGHQLTAHVGGILRCGSPWACPVCAPVVRQKRATEIDVGLGAALQAGMGVEFLTLTSRHHAGDDLAGRLDAMTGALHDVLQGSPWRRYKRALGYVGAIRAIEVTWGPKNGWHPHNHTALIFERPLTTSERQRLERWIAGRWARILDQRGFGSINEHGVDLRQVRGAGEIGGYLTKIDGGWSAGLELARGDLKRGRVDTVPATSLLVEFAQTGDADALSLWLEYERATFGKRPIVWSPGLRARLLGDELERSDEELAASEGEDVTLLRALVEAEVWRPIVLAGRVGELLTNVEQTAAALLTMCALWGVDPPPLDEQRSRATKSA